MHPRRTAIVATLAVLVVLPGCAGGLVPGPVTTTVSPVAEECGLASLSFASADGDGWGPTTARISYEATSATDVFVVVREGSEIVGRRHVQTSGPETVTNDSFGLDRSYEGTHTLYLVAYGDRDGDGTFDPMTDLSCRHGESPWVDSIAINFTLAG